MTQSELLELKSLQTTLLTLSSRVGAKYHDDIEAWLYDCILWPEGQGPAEYQLDVLTRLQARGRVATRQPRGSGKTAPASWATLHFATTRDGNTDWKVPSTAGSWLQLRAFLWPEIHKWAKRLRWDKLGMEPPNPRTQLLDLTMKLSTGSAFAINSNDADLLEGAHASALLAIIDEGKAVPEKSWDAIEGYFSDPGDKRALALSVPGVPAGRFYDIHARKPGYEDWDAVHVTIDQAIAAGRVSAKWADQREKQWGRDSPLFQNHVLAEFGGEEDGCVPLSWVEAAMERWRELKEEGRLGRVSIVSADIGDTGSDDTVLAMRAGDHIVELIRFPDGSTMQHAERIAARVPNGGGAIIDSIGVGAGVHARVKQLLKGRTSGFVASQGTKRKDKSGQMGFINKRAAAWWNMREILEPPSTIALPDDALLLGELAAPKWREAAGGKIQVESKAEIRKRIGRSTDSADAVIMGFWEDHGSRYEGVWPDDLGRSSPNRV